MRVAKRRVETLTRRSSPPGGAGDADDVKEDGDVTMERQRVLGSSFNLDRHAVVWKDARKVYGRRAVVDGISMGVKQGS